VIKVTDASGSPVSLYRYDAFGNHTVVGTEGYRSPILWQGRGLDSESDLYYFRNRYYAVKLGRFISEDPIGGKDGKNVYLFGDNDPVNLRDPLGLIPFCEDTETGSRCKDDDVGADWIECPNLNWFQCATVLDLMMNGGSGMPSLQEAIDWFIEIVTTQGWDAARSEFVVKTNPVGGEWNFKQGFTGPEREIRDVYGNIVYGAVGAIAGFTDYELRFAAGADQIVDDRLNGRRLHGFIFIGPNHGDALHDTNNIMVGYRIARPQRPNRPLAPYWGRGPF
jgi:RHS repeat-associated protein